MYINQTKTKHMIITRWKRQSRVKEVEIRDLKFEIVENFKYLEVNINNNNDRNIEVDHRIHMRRVTNIKIS